MARPTESCPKCLSELGAEVLPIGVQPDGENINRRCGALYPETAREVLLHEGADFAVALDGDADRAVFIDETGEILDGDQILAICALDMHEKGTLKGGGVVATVMSNLGLGSGDAEGRTGSRARARSAIATWSRRWLRAIITSAASNRGIFFFSIITRPATARSLVCRCSRLMVEKRKRLSELKSVMTRLPQVLLNVDVKERKDFAQMPKVAQKIAEVERALAGRGRVLGALLRHRAAGAGHVGRRG